MSTFSSTSQRLYSPSSDNTHQTHSIKKGEISLSTIVSHLLASKLSLASIKTVSRAKEIVISARATLEECAVIAAQTGFLRKGLVDQILNLQRFRARIAAAYDEGQKDFKNVIRTLDAADHRLEVTMNTLRSTMVEAAFRPEVEGLRCLLDFVDEQGVKTMRDTLKQDIREAQTAQTEFYSAILSLDDDLRDLKSSMTSQSASRSVSKYYIPIPDYLQCLESHAQQMADLLESLVQHFDLCVKAVRNTEGGTAAVRKATSSQPTDVDTVLVSGVTSPDNVSPDEDSIPDEEMQEILEVLDKDAEQVDDVVMELRGLLSDMEVKYQVILDFDLLLNTNYKENIKVFQLLEVVGLRLQGYVLARHDFSLRWDETKASIYSKLNELESIRLFYENYHSSYDALILEVHRRRMYQDRVQTILGKAIDQLDRIYEIDLREREEFRDDVGEFLPVDLWPGIGNLTPRWKFVRVDGGVDDTIPALDTAVIEGARKRARERER